MMKNRVLTAVLGAVAALISFSAFTHAASTAATPADSAATAGTGSVGGRIKNAATDRYLNSAQVSVIGTDIVVYTDETGMYRLPGLPAGRHTVVVRYSGLDDQTLTADVSPGTDVELNVGLSSVSRYGARSATVQLDPYTITADRDLNAQAAATQEQRAADNIKNVLSTDEYGGMVANSVGDFMKFMPGVTVEYSGNEVTGFAVRGIGGAMSSFTQDGAPVVFGSYVAASRIFNPYASDINNASRIETTKVPTPSTPADSIGGSINLVTKSVFDYDRPIGNYNVGLNVNSRYLETLNRTSTSRGDKKDFKYQPIASFDYRLPVNKKFGIFLSALYSPRAGNNAQERTRFVASATGTGATVEQPYLQQVFESDDPRIFTKSNLTFRADWRVTPHSVLSLTFSAGKNKSLIGDEIRILNIGNNGTSAVAGGQALTFGPTFVNGATGRGNVVLQANFQEFNGGSRSPTLSYRFDDGLWKLSAMVSASESYMEKDNPIGPFSVLAAQTIAPLRLNVTGSGYGRRPAGVEAFDNNSRPYDIGNIANYSVTTAQEVFYRNKAEVQNADLKVKRRLQFLPFPSSIEAGGTHMVKRYENRGWVKNLTYNGPDGNAATVDPIPQSYLMQVYTNHSNFTPGYATPFLSPDRVWEAWLNQPNLFTPTTAQAVAAENNRRQTSGNIFEQNSALFLQGSAQLFGGRLNVLTGVRYERTLDRGRGPLFDPDAVFIRNADGSFARNAQRARIRRPEAGAAGSMEELNLTTVELGARAEKHYDGYYPSLHLTYALKENFLARVAYARTFGRPDFIQIIPGTTIREDDNTSNPDAASTGSISVRNIGLRPWKGDNYDLSIEYYTHGGGIFSVGAFVKEMTDFFGTQTRLASVADLEALGLDADYEGWRLSSMFNAGDARVSGVEFNARQSLTGLTRWGKFFSMFANGTKLHLEGARRADFSSFISESVNWGLSFRNKRTYVGVKWNYRGLDKRLVDPVLGPDAWEYWKPSVTVDADVSYALTPRMSVALNISNLTNSGRSTRLAYQAETPDYARNWWRFETGAHYTLSVKGTF
jgi:iron complex outermembrane recepter protein